MIDSKVIQQPTLNGTSLRNDYFVQDSDKVTKIMSQWKNVNLLGVNKKKIIDISYVRWLKQQFL